MGRDKTRWVLSGLGCSQRGAPPVSRVWVYTPECLGHRILLLSPVAPLDEGRGSSWFQLSQGMAECAAAPSTPRDTVKGMVCLTWGRNSGTALLLVSDSLLNIFVK